MEYSGKRYPEDSWVLHWGFEFITFIPFYHGYKPQGKPWTLILPQRCGV